MLNVSSTPISWPTPVSAGAIAPVPSVTAVPTVQTGGQDGKTQMGFGRDGRAASQPQAGNTPARLPGEARANADSTALAGAGEVAGQPAAHDVAAQRQARQEAAEAAEQKQTKDKKAVEHLQTVLSRMWEASAAVVDRALGLEPAAEPLPGNQSDTAPDLSAVAASTMPRQRAAAAERAAQPALPQLPWPVMPEGHPGTEIDVVGDGVGADGSTADVVAYDEHGNGSQAPVEAGAIIDERV